MGSFEPKIVRKRRRPFEGFDQKILALYSRGFSVRHRPAHAREIYGVEVSTGLISQVTDAVVDDARSWQQQPLDDVCPLLFLNSFVAKIREAGASSAPRLLPRARGGDGRVTGRARDVVPDERGCQALMWVLTELRQRGVRDIVICCVDGLKGFPRGDEAVLPEAVVQTCIMHLIRTSLTYVPRWQYDQVVKHVKPIYTAINSDAAEQALEAFDQKWGAQLPVITQAWRDSWGARHPVPGLRTRDLPGDLHHGIEALNGQLRRQSN